MTLCYRSTRQEDVPVSSAVSVPDEMTPRNMPAPHKSQVFIELNFFTWKLNIIMIDTCSTV